MSSVGVRPKKAVPRQARFVSPEKGNSVYMMGFWRNCLTDAVILNCKFIAYFNECKMLLSVLV